MVACETVLGEGVLSFSDQTNSTGVIATQRPVGIDDFLAGGAVGDFDNDGWQDIFFPAGGDAPDKLFINNGNGTFTDRAVEWGIALQQRSTGAAVADYDADGLLDIYVTNLGYVPGDPTMGSHRLYRNTGSCGFEDVAQAAGVNFSSAIATDGWGAAWGDYDLDGDLDLAVAGHQTADGNRLFRNNGDGTFTDVTESAGLTALSTTIGYTPRFVDMNGDRYPEIIWIGDFNTGEYFVNNTDGTFTNYTTESGVNIGLTEMGMAVADFNEDGLFDFYVTTSFISLLYINQGGDTFIDVGQQAGVWFAGFGWATVGVDLNHDTRTDIAATANSPRQFVFINNVTQVGSVGFEEVALDVGVTTTVAGRGLANFDYDNDGDQDLIFFPYNDSVVLYRNDLTGTDINWLRVFLERGEVTDVPPNGIGSVVKVILGGRTLMGRIDGGSNYLSQSELSAHFGLGSATIVDELRVEWSNGLTTVLTGVAANQTLVITAQNPALGDFDGDGDLDAEDFGTMLDCLAGPEQPPNPTGVTPQRCLQTGDFDGDGDVDLGDAAGFLLGLTG